MIDIRTLRAAGLTSEQILKVIEEDQAKVREQNRKRQRKQRARHGDMRDGCDMPLTVLPPIERPTFFQEERSEIVALAKTAEPKKRKRSLPDDWEPKGEQRDPIEPDEFRDHARAKGYQYIDWDAAYRNFQKSQYNARNRGGQNGQGRRHGSVLDAADRLREKLKQAGASEDYVLGSSGPRPLDLDHQVRPANLRIVSKG